MDNGSSPDQQPNPESSPETAKGKSLEQIAEYLGFVETAELRLVRLQAKQAHELDEPERLKDLLIQYHLFSQELADTVQGGENMRARVGHIVAMAGLHKETGNMEACLDAIYDAKSNAYEMYEDEVISQLEKILSSEIAGILSILGEEYGFDEETCAEIAAEPYDRAFEMAYGYLMQAGLDAEEILAPFMKRK